MDLWIRVPAGLAPGKASCCDSHMTHGRPHQPPVHVRLCSLRFWCPGRSCASFRTKSTVLRSACPHAPCPLQGNGPFARGWGRGVTGLRKIGGWFGEAALVTGPVQKGKLRRLGGEGGGNQHNPRYANHWAPLTHKRHPPQPAPPRHTNDWAPRTRKRHQQEHRPQRPTERSDPTQHAKGRTGDCPGPRKGTTTRRNVTQGGGLIVGQATWRQMPGKVCSVPGLQGQRRTPMRWGGGVGFRAGMISWEIIVLIEGGKHFPWRNLGVLAGQGTLGEAVGVLGFPGVAKSPHPRAAAAATEIFPCEIIPVQPRGW